MNSYGFLCLEEMVWFAQDFVSVLRRNSHENEHFLGIKNAYGEILHVDEFGLEFAYASYYPVDPYSPELELWLTAHRKLLEAQGKGIEDAKTHP